jgi:RNA polymerase primary sigma factor
MRQLKIEQSITVRDTIALQKYFQEVSSIEMITADEEAELARRIRKGDQNALEKLVTANLRFVVSVAKQYQNYGISLNDLINEGNIGLIRAAQKFDETKGFKFISYAVWWIRQNIQNAIQDQGRIVRIPANRSGLLLRIKRATDSFYQLNNREPDAYELADMLEKTEREVKGALAAKVSQFSFDEPVSDEDSTTKMDLFNSGEENNISNNVNVDSLRKEVKGLLTRLNEQEKTVIVDFFGISTNEPRTLSEIAGKMDISKERVRQIKSKALKKLNRSKKEHLKEYL